MLQLDPPLPIKTPKGNALCHFIIDDGIEHDLLWVCFQDDTGECWTWSNKDIRAQKNITAGREYISPFYEPKERETGSWSQDFEWISVNDKLPEDVPYGQHRFLVMCACSHMAHQAVARNFPYPCSGVNIAYWSNLNYCWSFADLTNWDPDVYVTHWRPLPQPPEVK